MLDGKSQIALEILAYLKRNPHAEDTLEGIFRWWLPSQHLERNKERVQAALSYLETKNLVLRQERGGAWTFKINHEQDYVISALVEWLSD